MEKQHRITPSAIASGAADRGDVAGPLVGSGGLLSGGSSLATIAAPEYILGADESERLRLLAQCDIHRREAELLLEHINVPLGGRAIDIGCGPLGVLDLLRERVGPAGSVVGLDNERRMLAFAQRTVSERALTNVTLALGDAVATSLPADSSDLAHARLVFVNHAEPDAVVREMVRVVRPGGAVALQEVDWISWTCEPPHPAWDRLLTALVGAWRAARLDPFIGRRLAGILTRAGLRDVDIAAHSHLWRAGDPYQTLLLKFIGIFQDRILEHGLLSIDELSRLTAELSAHLAQPETFVIYALFFQAWGRKPA